MSTRFSRFRWLSALSAPLLATALLAACGGNVVVDDPTGGAGTGATGGASTVTLGTGASSTSTSEGSGGSVSGCPQPHMLLCDAIEACPCLDGTTQEGGCINGFDCPQACCGHGGSK